MRQVAGYEAAGLWFGGNKTEQSQRLDIHGGVVIWR